MGLAELAPPERRASARQMIYTRLSAKNLCRLGAEFVKHTGVGLHEADQVFGLEDAERAELAPVSVKRSSLSQPL
jgi:hypothetical protein